MNELFTNHSYFKINAKTLLADASLQIYVKHPLNAQCPYIKYWPADGSLQPQHVASCVL